MSDSPVSRGEFLRSFGKSMTGMALNAGVVVAAQTLAKRFAAATPPPSDQLMVKKTEAPLAADPFIYSGPTEGNRIALTFDDGPTPGVTDRILDELKQRQLHATFFMIGKNVVAQPDLARRVLAEGHEIGNHTFTHPKLNTLPEAQAVAEVEKAQQTFTDVLNYHAKWFRPPCGALRKNQSGILHDKNLGIVFWSVDPGDWAQPGEAHITDFILSQTKPGSIILCHDLYPQTAHCVGLILDGLLQRGFNLVTLSTLLPQAVGHSATSSMP